MENKVVLGYWQIRGLSERIRMIMEYTGLPYDEEKYDGSGEADRQRWFKEVKPELSKKNPAITLPYLKDGDEVISESDAIIVHVIHKAGKCELLGRNGQEQVRIATTYGVCRDLHKTYIELVYGGYGDKPFEEAKVQYCEKFKPFLCKLNDYLGDRQFFAGEITWIDFVMAEFLQCVRLLNEELIKGYPNLNAHIDRVWELEAIKAYHQTDRFKERPCNNYPHAKWA